MYLKSQEKVGEFKFTGKNARLAYSKILAENKPNRDWGEGLTVSGATYYFEQGFTPNMRVELKFKAACHLTAVFLNRVIKTQDLHKE